jgi:hypothetical protein
MQALFSRQQKDSKPTYKGKTAVGVVFSVVFTGFLVAGMTQQTGNVPAHWSAGGSQVVQPVQMAVAAASKNGNDCATADSARRSARCQTLVVSAKKPRSGVPAAMVATQERIDGGAIQLAASSTALVANR